MNHATLNLIANEIADAVIGQTFGRVFPLSKDSFAIDFRSHGSRYLFISVDPADPRIYMVRRRLRELEKASVHLPTFFAQLRARFPSAAVSDVRLLENERVLFIDARSRDEIGNVRDHSLAVQLTGRSSNLFHLDDKGTILDSLRPGKGDGQTIGAIYKPPARPEHKATGPEEPVVAGKEFESLSDALDAISIARESRREFESAANSARSAINQKIAKREKLIAGLASDLKAHGDAEKWKRYGDLLLANLANAKRDGEVISVVDYFDENTPTIEIKADASDSITEAAEKYFKRYTKARNARDEIERRTATARTELEKLRRDRDTLEAAIDSGDREAVERSSSAKRPVPTGKSKEGSPAITNAVRVFRSSDGFEILVGKKAKDNDHLTFRIARSLDTWMHAADYPGSHVVIRNPDRKEIPPTTLVEAAELAAFYSKGKAQPKAAVHYTQKKFVNKRKGSAPGLVSLASFKTVLVEPKVPAGVQLAT